jgi:hypothetical protein
MDTVSRLASPTGQWPEAIHPRTLGGCMGDGQHMWAACEWALMVRNCFVREEPERPGSVRARRLVIAAGVRPSWWQNGEASLGGTQTPFGPVTVRVMRIDARPAERGGASAPAGVRVRVEANWRGTAPELDVQLPGYAPQARTAGGAVEEFILSPS